MTTLALVPKSDIPEFIAKGWIVVCLLRGSHGWWGSVLMELEA